MLSLLVIWPLPGTSWSFSAVSDMEMNAINQKSIQLFDCTDGLAEGDIRIHVYPSPAGWPLCVHICQRSAPSGPSSVQWYELWTCRGRTHEWKHPINAYRCVSYWSLHYRCTLWILTNSLCLYSRTLTLRGESSLCQPVRSCPGLGTFSAASSHSGSSPTGHTGRTA